MEKVVSLIDKETIDLRIKEIAKKISEDYKGKEVVMICVLKGAAPFFTDLCQEIVGVNVKQEYLKASSYDKEESNKNPTVEYLYKIDIKDKDVIVVEDIIDTGYSLDYLVNTELPMKGPKSIEVAVMLDKTEGREVGTVTPKYTGFAVPDLFVVGKGLDYDEEYRFLPFVGVLESKLNRSIDQDIQNIKAQLGTPVTPKEDNKFLGKNVNI